MTIELTHDQACIVRMYLNCWMDDTSDYYHHLPAELFVPDEDEDEDVEPDPDLCREALTAYDAKWMIVERPPADEGLIKATGQTYVPKVPPRPTIDDEAILRKAAAQLAVKIASWTDKESLASDRQLIEALTWASWKNAYKMARSIEHIICDIDAGFIDQLNEYADDILCGICRAATAKWLKTSGLSAPKIGSRVWYQDEIGEIVRNDPAVGRSSVRLSSCREGNSTPRVVLNWEELEFAEAAK